MDKELSRIIDLYWADYVEHKEKPFVVNPSIPIIWFGDMEAYKKSKLRVVTVALNPSDKEFRKDNQLSFFRFKNGEKIHSKTKLDETEKSILKETLSNYFKDEPYDNWFNCFEKPLNALDSSYKCGENIALHIDIYTALATNPTWGGLKKEEKQMLTDGNARSKELFNSLMEYLSPDVILYSANKTEFKKTFSLTKNDCIKCYPSSSKGFNIEVYRYQKHFIITGRNNYGKPFKLKDEFVKQTLTQITEDFKEVFYK